VTSFQAPQGLPKGLCASIFDVTGDDWRVLRLPVERYCTDGTHVGLPSRGSTCKVGERIVSVFVEFFVQAVRTISVN
jgi:hypothetical protein